MDLTPEERARRRARGWGDPVRSHSMFSYSPSCSHCWRCSCGRARISQQTQKPHKMWSLRVQINKHFSNHPYLCRCQCQRPLRYTPKTLAGRDTRPRYLAMRRRHTIRPNQSCLSRPQANPYYHHISKHINSVLDSSLTRHFP